MELVLEQFIIEATGAASISNTELIQEVWSGFGQVLRVTLQGAMAESVIVKNISISSIA